MTNVIIKQQLMDLIDKEIRKTAKTVVPNSAMKRYVEGMNAALRNLRNDVETMACYEVYINNMELFNHKCPYTGAFCETFHCEGCQVEADERAWMEEEEGAAE